MTDEPQNKPESNEVTEAPVAKTETPEKVSSEKVESGTKESETKKSETTTTKTKEKTTPKSDPIDGHWWWGTGRRKSSVARVRIRPGKGEFKVNNRDLVEYFTEARDQKDILKILEKSNTTGAIDVMVRANGGGYTGQAGAILLGLGRALSKYDPALEAMLRDQGYLSRDPRQVERKKPGQPGARKRFQFSKR